MPSLLCETVTGDTMAQLLAARDAAVAADMVELRLDGVCDLDLRAAIHGRRQPLIVTCRPAWEGGRFTGGEDDRGSILARALELGADYVDVEWRALHASRGTRLLEDLVRAYSGKIVLSSHDFDGVPKDLCARAGAMRATGAAVIKVAVAASRLSDTLPLLDIAKEGSSVVIGMGDAGVPSRLLASRFGSRWTYAGAGMAPGQIPAARMLGQFRFRSVSDSTSLYGVVGHGVMHSPLAAMHNAAFDAARLDAVCVPLPAADFSDFLIFADALTIRGASVAPPYAREAQTGARFVGDPVSPPDGIDSLRRGADGWEAANTALDEAPADVDDLPGLVARAERQFEWWTGRRPMPGVMQAAAREIR